MNKHQGLGLLFMSPLIILLLISMWDFIKREIIPYAFYWALIIFPIFIGLSFLTGVWLVFHK